MKNPQWFIRDRQMGKYWKGPMEYQPKTWQGWIILFIHTALTLALIYFIFILTFHLLFIFLGLLIGMPILLASYSMIASFFSSERNKEMKNPPFKK